MPSASEQYLELPTSKSPGLLANKGSKLAVICTHPWGPLGGNLHNNVVSAVVLYFQKINVSTLRFDFSGSQISRGLQQVTQVEEAAKYLYSLPEGAPQYILLIGYSYGSLIAGSATANIYNVVGSISIAPPFAVKHWLLMFNSNYHIKQAQKQTALPRLMILGTNDNFTNEESFQAMLQTYPTGSTTGALLKGADHFFHRREKDLMDIIGQWIFQTYRVSSLLELSSMEFVPSGVDFRVSVCEEKPVADQYGCGALASTVWLG